jgi:site-specific DNA-methyltransferase (adenine-specific)
MEINKIYNENCLDTMAKMPDNFIDLTVTSPPYDNLRDYKGYSFPFEDIAKELYRVTKQGGVVVWIVGDATINGSETGTSFKQALYFKEIGFNLHDTMIYLKDGFAFPEATRYQPIFEYMFVFSKDKPKTFNPIKRKNVYGAITKLERERQKDGTISATKMRYQLEDGNLGNVWLYGTGYMKTGKDKIAYKHPAQFPEQMALDHIYSWSKEGDLIYDCFGGSGTTAKMAHKYKRNWILSEISKEYCQIAEKRLKPYLLQLTAF